ncbi:MAG: carboxy terminal-processing peptidase [SAR86 cluster bacterium]|uniref:Carboxy terminal-processing peptidase n=1 Tax=SAR86 cluster bacterium TaxID=2030880 RepID=A0A937LCI7_9GAMM|nr:carboxy terminal-processing peptidase [SAR86 cluster bacterium]
MALKFNKILVLLIYFLTSLNLPSEEFLEVKNEYKPVINEIIEILDQNHFKKNIEINEQKVIDNFLVNIDKEKIVFTSGEFNSYKARFKNIYSLDEIFKIYQNYSDRTLELINYQKDAVNLIITSSDLNTTEFIKKSREDEKRFNSLGSIKNYHALLIKNEFINILLSNDNFENSKSKLLKRLKNRIKSLKRIKSDDIFSLYINSITSLYDPHTNYLSPKSQEDFEINMSLSLEGIGAILSIEDGITKIVRLIPGGPADKSGLLKVNDKIVGVASLPENDIEDVRDWRIDEVVRLIRGPKNTKVRLEIIPNSSPDDILGRVIEITRGLVKLEDQAAKKKKVEIYKPNKSYNIGVIDLPAFYMDFDAFSRNQFNYKSSSKDVRNLLRELKEEQVDGVILDLRGNSGGSLYEAYSLAKLFIGKGSIVQVMESNGSIQPLGHTRGIQNYDGPVMILVDKLSASASEILAGAFQDYKRGLIVGSNTFGKGTVQRLENLSYGQLKFTEQKFYRVSGKSTQNLGVIPDINLPYVFDSEEVGEMALENSLPYDDISSLEYEPFNSTSNIEMIQSLSKKRVSDSNLNEYIKDQKIHSKKELDKKLIPVNYLVRKSEKRAQEEKRLFIENRFRVSVGLKPYLNFQEFLDADPEELNEFSEKMVLEEAARILIDQINFNKPKRLSSLEFR